MFVTLLIFIFASLLSPVWLSSHNNDLVENAVYDMKKCPVIPKKNVETLAVDMTTRFPSTSFAFSAKFSNEVVRQTAGKEIQELPSTSVKHVVIFCGNIFGFRSTNEGNLSMTLSHILISTNSLATLKHLGRNILPPVESMTRLDGGRTLLAGPQFTDSVGCADYEARIRETNAQCRTTTMTTTTSFSSTSTMITTSAVKSTLVSSISSGKSLESSTLANATRTTEGETSALDGLNSTSGETLTSPIQVLGNDGDNTGDGEAESTSTAKSTSASSPSPGKSLEISTIADIPAGSGANALEGLNLTSGENVFSPMDVLGDGDANTGGEGYEEVESISTVEGSSASSLSPEKSPETAIYANTTKESEADALGMNATYGENVTSEIEVPGHDGAHTGDYQEERTTASDSTDKKEENDRKNGKEDDSGTSYVAFIVVGIVVIVIVIIILAVAMAKKKKEKQAGTTKIGTESPPVMPMSKLKQMWQEYKDKKARKPAAKTTGDLEEQKSAVYAVDFLEDRTEAEVVEEMNLGGQNQAPNPAAETQNATIPADSAAQEETFKPAGQSSTEVNVAPIYKIIG